MDNEKYIQIAKKIAQLVKEIEDIDILMQKEADTKQFDSLGGFDTNTCGSTNWKNWKNYQSSALEKIEANNKAISYAIACEKLKKLSKILEENSVYLRSFGSTSIVEPIPGSDFSSPYSAIVEIEKWKMENEVKMKTADDTISLQFTKEENITAFFEKEITKEKIEVAIICVPVR
jgi:hypothetical protein